MKTPDLRWYTVASIACIAFLVGGATSAAIFWSTFEPSATSPTPLDPTLDEAIRAEATSDTDPISKSNNGRTSNIVANSDGLASLQEISNEFDRNLALYQRLSKMDKDQLVEIARESVHLKSSIKREFQDAIFQRLALLDPKLAFNQAGNLDVMDAIFSQWSVTDLNEAISHAKTLGQLQRLMALRTILKSRRDLPEDILLQIGTELDQEGEAQRLINSYKTEEYLENPGESWHEVVDKVQDDLAQTGLLFQMAGAWFEQEGLSVIDEINKSLSNDQIRTTVLGRVLDMATKTNPHGTFELVVNMSAELDDKFIERVAHNWGTTDLNSALLAVDAIEPTPLQERLLVAAMRSWARQYPLALLDRLEGLSETTRAKGQELAIEAIARERPEQAAPLLLRMDDSSTKRKVAHKVASKWMELEPRPALNWILTDVGIAPYRHHLLQSVLPTLAEDSPQLAFDTALNQPLVEGEPSLESTVVAMVARDNLDMAVEMLPQVRERKSKISASLVVGNMMVLRGSPLDAVELSQQLPESDREAYFLMTMSTWSERDPEGLFKTIDQFPSAQAKSKAAAMLTFGNQFDKQLTDKQIEQLGKFLSAEDAKSLEEGGMGLLNPIMELGFQ